MAATTSIPPLILASASPARHRLLTLVGLDPIVCPSHFDESSIQVDDPKQLVKTLARRKAESVTEQIVADPSAVGLARPFCLVIGCDSVLELMGQTYGKPDSEAEAIARWQQMAGQTGYLHTGHALIEIKPEIETGKAQIKAQVQSQTTQVTFAALSDRQIEAYVRSGEPLQCAGSFALEGRGGLFVEGIQGCHTNVIGLSLPLLRRMLADMNYDVTDFWSLSQESI